MQREVVVAWLQPVGRVAMAADAVTASATPPTASAAAAMPGRQRWWLAPGTRYRVMMYLRSPAQFCDVIWLFKSCRFSLHSRASYAAWRDYILHYMFDSR